MIATTQPGRGIDAADVKLAGTGKEIELLVNVAHIPREYLDGRGHPCCSPVCGGEGHDRLSLVDEKQGAVLCRRCFNSRNGDWLSAIMHFREVDFPEAVRLAAEYLGLEPTPKKMNGKPASTKKTNKKPKADPAAKLKFIDWVETFAQMFCQYNPGVTVEALRLAGARMAYYYDRYTVIALPIYGPKLLDAEPVGWIVQDFMGGTLPRFDKSGKVVEWVKRKITYGSQPGVVGDAAARGLADPNTDTVYKMEGPSDMLAMMACLLAEPRPGTIAITTGCGAGERLAKLPWLIDRLKGRELRVVHDCDEAGQRGAEAILADVAHLCTAKNFVLPYPVQKNKGPDFRDYKTNCLSQGVTQLLTRLDTAFEKIEPAKPTDSRRSAAEAGGGDEELSHYEAAAQIWAESLIDRASEISRYCSHQKNWWKWTGHVWEELEEDFLSQVVWQHLHMRRLRPTRSKVASVLEALRMMVLAPQTDATSFWLSTPSDIPRGCDLSTVIPTKTKLIFPRPGVDAADWPTFPRTAQFFTTGAHNFDFVQDGGRLIFPDCLRWKNFLGEIFGGEEDQIQTLQTWFGYCLTGETNQQKFLLLSGPKRSGKSLLAKILRLVVGSHLSTSTSLLALAGPHGMASMVGRRLAILADERRLSKQTAAEVLPRILSITGEDFVPINQKYRAEYTTRLSARLLVLSNETSPLLDEADALTSRMLLLRTRRSFSGNEDIRLEEALQAELPGVLAWSLEGLRAILDGHRLQSPQSTEEDLEAIRDDSNPLSEFFAECLVDDPGGWVSNDNLHDAVRHWADKRQLATVARTSSKRIGELLLSARPHITRSRKWVFGKQMRGFSGVRLEAPIF